MKYTTVTENHFDAQYYSDNMIGMMSDGRIGYMDRNNFSILQAEYADRNILPHVVTSWGHQRRTHARKCSVYNMRVSRAQPSYEPFNSVDTGEGCVIGIGHLERQYLKWRSKEECNLLQGDVEYHYGGILPWLVYWGFSPYHLLLPEFQ